MSLTLGEASRQSGFAKSSLSQAVSKGRLAAVRRENGSFAIDEAELARFVEANAPPVRVERVECVETLPSVQSGTAIDELVAARVRADVAEKMLVVLQHQLAEMTAQRDRWEVALQARLTEMTAQRDRWEQRFDQLKLPAVNTGERRPWWRRLAG
jgi:hypothetical protein